MTRAFLASELRTLASTTPAAFLNRGYDFPASPVALSGHLPPSSGNCGGNQTQRLRIGRSRGNLPYPLPAFAASGLASVASNDMPRGPVVSADWLHDNLSLVKVLDCSWYMPAEKRDPFLEFQHSRIPTSIFFDIDAISDASSSLPHMLPREDAFALAASLLGLSNSDTIILYDGKGIFSAARGWWMLRAFGHQNVFVLEGGLPAWKAGSFKLVAEPEEQHEELQEAVAQAVKAQWNPHSVPLSYRAVLQPHLVKSLDDVLQNIASPSFQLVDARSAGRFLGIDPEPRAGIRGGHVPGSCNVPFPQVLTSNGELKLEEELELVFQQAGLNLDGSSPIVATCGTGVTACVLALALSKLGRDDVAVYDGSWTEWGSSETTPVDSSSSS